MRKYLTGQTSKRSLLHDLISWRQPIMYALLLCICVSGCGQDDSSEPMEESNQSLKYDFESRFGEGSSVSYSGQTARHALIYELKQYMSSLESKVSTQGIFEEGALVSIFDVFFDCTDEVCSGEELTLKTSIDLKQKNIGEISSGKNLVGKLAGNDPIGQHKDWTMEFMGWGDTHSPESLIRAWFKDIEDQAITLSNGEVIMAMNGEVITRPDLSPNGLDYTQLINKLLLGAVTFSQGVDDYLDDSEMGKGLLSNHSIAVEGELYSELEHSWDEAFGYFGAARDYLDYSDDELSSEGGRDDYQGSHDSDSDGKIDLVSEYSWGHSVNAAKRDRGHDINLTRDAYHAFYKGRELIGSIDRELNEGELDTLKTYRDQAVEAWEKAISSTVIHYMNETIVDMKTALETPDQYEFSDHAKHWSEMKGFALSLQFNPRSPLNAEDFRVLHEAIGIAPCLPGDDQFEANLDALVVARDQLGVIYGFSIEDTESW